MYSGMMFLNQSHSKVAKHFLLCTGFIDYRELRGCFLVKISRDWISKPQQKFLIKHHLNQPATALKWLTWIVYPSVVHTVWCMCQSRDATGSSMNQSLREDEKEWPLDLTEAWPGTTFVDLMFCCEERSMCVGTCVGVCMSMSDPRSRWCEIKSWGRWCRCLVL